MGGKWTLPNLGRYSGIVWRNWGQPHKASVRSWSADCSNMKQDILSLPACQYWVCWLWLFTKGPSWEATSSTAIQLILCIVCSPKVHHLAQNSPSLVPILSQINTSHAVSPCLFTICFNITLLSPCMASSWSLSIRFPHHNSVCISQLPACHMHPPSHPPRFSSP